LDGVEGLVHISELAPHHVENPREIVAPSDDVKVKILEIDSERRRLSLSVKRVEGQVLEPKVLPPEELAALDDGDEVAPEHGTGDLDDVPQLGLSEEVPAGDPAAAEPAEGDDDAAAELEREAVVEPEAAEGPEAVVEPEAAEAVEPDADDPEAVESAADQPAAT
ncbi:MAG: S1 RNA-binding domain-containing protein, partial [Actinomycetota bacterium]|nr:S1 RNA-binding domain-containing protein [Actinomycetota bacterium]